MQVRRLGVEPLMPLVLWILSGHFIIGKSHFWLVGSLSLPHKSVYTSIKTLSLSLLFYNMLTGVDYTR